MEASPSSSPLAAPLSNGAQRPHLRVLRHDEPDSINRHPVTQAVVSHALHIAQEVQASALLLPAEFIEDDPELFAKVKGSPSRTILFSPEARSEMCDQLGDSICRITIPNVRMNRAGQVKAAILVSLAQGLLTRDDRVVCVVGLHGAAALDACLVLELKSEPELFSAAETILLSGDASPAVFERALLIASQLASEGREGRPIGTLFVIGDSDNVLAQSRRLVLNPFHGYPESERNILDPNLQETIKEYSAIDGAFIIRGDGVVLAAGRQLTPPAAGRQLLNGLGTRHAAACAVTASTDAVAIVISQSTGTISVFKGGAMITDIQRPISHPRNVD